MQTRLKAYAHVLQNRTLNFEHFLKLLQKYISLLRWIYIKHVYYNIIKIENFYNYLFHTQIALYNAVYFNHAYIYISIIII